MTNPVETDPITEAVEQFIASIPASAFEDKPVLVAFLNWFRSQDIDRAHMCSAMATMLGLFVGAIAEDKADLRKGLAIYAKQIRGAASLTAGPFPEPGMIMEAKQGYVAMPKLNTLRVVRPSPQFCVGPQS